MTDDNVKKFPYGQLATAVKTPHELAGQSATDAIVQEKLHDAMTPGFEAEFSVDEADHAGAFVEDALSPDEAAASAPDLMRSTSIDE